MYLNIHTLTLITALCNEWLLNSLCTHLHIDQPPYFTFPKTWTPTRNSVSCCAHYVRKKAAKTYVVGERSIKEGNSITNALMLANDSNRGD